MEERGDVASSSHEAPDVGEYDVFISHCGEESKRDFAILLKEELERPGLRCFLDEDALEVGDEAASKMLKAMKTATYGVVILSPGFYLREWCMKELETFVKRGKIVPIYLPSYESVQEGLKAAKDQKVWARFRQFVRTEDEYAAAAGASFTGVRLDACDGFWNICFHKVKVEMLRLLGRVEGGVRLSDLGLLVGLGEHLVKLKGLLGMYPEQQSAGRATEITELAGEVGIVGLRGMGGIGKSTLAKKLYDEEDVRDWFGGNICWLNVGSNPSDEKLCKLQSVILSKLCNLEKSVPTTDEGRALIKERLRGKKVLICLDDVWGDVGIETPIVRIDDLEPGSRILKTSRNATAIGGVVYSLDVLGAAPAWELFCWHAFAGRTPPSELFDVAQLAAAKCAGLPLAIKLVGRQVALAKDEKRRCLEAFLALPAESDAMRNCRSIIRVSYDNLPTTDPVGLKEAFILIAAVWPDTVDMRAQERLVQNLAASVYGEYGWQRRERMAERAVEMLADRSFIKYEERKDGLHIVVHDLLADVAGDLASQGQRSRRPYFVWKESDEDEFPTESKVSWEHVRISAGERPDSCRIPANFLTAPDSKVTSLVAESKLCVVLENSEGLQGLSSCKLLSISGGQMARFQMFKDLQCLRLLHCPLGRFPTEVELLKNLRILEIVDCKVEGRLPLGLSALTKLRTIVISQNWLRTSLPREWVLLTGLTMLDLSNNQLIEDLPQDWSQLTRLVTLNLSSNKLTGDLPIQWAALEGLQALDLSRNQLSGTLPPEWVQLTGMQKLALNHNLLAGNLPDGWAGLSRLRKLHLHSNRLEGPLPGEWKALTALEELTLWSNYFNQALPKDWAALRRLQVLALDDNQLSGPLPDEWAALTNLETLVLRSNQLSGELPAKWAALSRLKGLYLNKNDLSGPLPAEWGALKGLRSLLLADNNLNLAYSGIFESDTNARGIYKEVGDSGVWDTAFLPVEIDLVRSLVQVNLYPQRQHRKNNIKPVQQGVPDERSMPSRPQATEIELMLREVQEGRSPGDRHQVSHAGAMVQSPSAECRTVASGRSSSNPGRCCTLL